MDYGLALNFHRMCPLQVQGQSMMLRLSNTDDIPILGISQSLSACIEPYYSPIRLPNQDVQTL